MTGSAPRVLLLPSWYPTAADPVGGGFVRDQARTLAAEHATAVAYPAVIGVRQYVRQGFAHAHTIPAGPADPPVFGAWRVARGPLPSRLYYRTYLDAAREALRRAVEGWGVPELIHAHVVLPAGWAAVRLGAELGIPVVLTAHSDPRVHLASGVQRRLARETLRGCARVVAVSPALAEQLRAVEPGLDVAVLGNVIRTDELVPPGPGRDPEPTRPVRFLAVAHLGGRKGIEHLLEAAGALRREHGGRFRLEIGGDGPMRPRLEAQARTLGLEGHCTFLGRLDRGGVLAAMQRCDAFVLPSLYETFGVVLGEAMACGKPVVATRCGGPEWVVTPETGVLVPPANAGALAGAMAGFIEGRYGFDPRVVRRVVEERFGPRAFLDGVARVYAEALGGAPARTPERTSA